jgi:hypothetical protein
MLFPRDAEDGTVGEALVSQRGSGVQTGYAAVIKQESYKNSKFKISAPIKPMCPINYGG